MNRTVETLLIIVLPVVGLYFLCQGLIVGKPFLAPLLLAGLLAMMILPVCTFLEKVMPRGVASVLSVLGLLVLMLGFLTLFYVEVNRIAEDWPGVKERLRPDIKRIETAINEKTGIQFFDASSWYETNGAEPQPPADVERPVMKDSPPETVRESGQTVAKAMMNGGNANGGTSGGMGGIHSMVGSALLNAVPMISVTALVAVYVFFFLMYREKIKTPLLMLSDPGHRDEMGHTLDKITDVGKHYLVGRMILILILAVLYTVGLMLSGVEHALIISSLAALLTIVPYIGSVGGFILAMSIAVFSNVSPAGYLGVAITFGLAQFLESNILEPYVIGKKVQVNPLLTLIAFMLGGVIWGVVGMILFIPLFGMGKIAADHISGMEPLAYLLGQKNTSSK